MMTDPDYFKNKYRIESSRHQEYDYAEPGFYFVTICTEKRICCLGEIVRMGFEDVVVKLSEIGKIVRNEWQKTEIIRPNILLDEFVIMPNHVHGIIEIIDNSNNDPTYCRDAVNNFQIDVEPLHNNNDQNNSRDARSRVSIDLVKNDTDNRDARSRVSTNGKNRFGPLKPGSLSTIVHAYKAAVKRWCNKNGHGDFAWQERFHDRIIRDEKELGAVRQYIIDNPLKWEIDKNNPNNVDK